MLKNFLKVSAQHYLRSGPRFRRLLSQLQSNAAFSYEQLVEYQNEQLRISIHHAYNNIPYYRNLFDRLGLTPEDFHAIEDLKQLPLINRKELYGREPAFVSKRRTIKYRKHTSGTTGTPLTLWRDLYNADFEQACQWRQWRWYGLDSSNRMVNMRGIFVAPVDRVEPPFWMYVPANKQLLLSSYHLSDALIPHYLEKLREFQPVAFKSMPSTIFRLAQFMQLHGESPIPVKAVMTISEKLFKAEKETIERFFGPVFDSYGNAERAALIAMCEHRTYHYMMDYSIIEFIPREDGLFEVVGTTLHNRAMPLIRYATGDLVAPGSGSCSCGRAFPVIKSIQGRREDSVVTPSGRWLSAHLSMAFYRVPNVRKSQIIQEEPDLLRVLVVPAEGFSTEEKKLIAQNLKKVIGNEMSIVIVEVAEIPLTKGGKHQFVVSKIALELSDASV